MAESLTKISDGTGLVQFVPQLTATYASPKKGNGMLVAIAILGCLILLILYLMYRNDYYPFSSKSSNTKTPAPPPLKSPPTSGGPTPPTDSTDTTNDTTGQDTTYKGDPFDFVLGNDKIIKINNHGCWKDYDSLRIMNGANTFGWEWKGCIWEAAKRNRNMCGMQAGGECWIPADNYMTPQTVIDKSRIKMEKPGECGMGGSAYVMHLYSWSDAMRDQIANGGNPG